MALAFPVANTRAQRLEDTFQSPRDTSALAALHAVIRRENPDIVARRTAVEAAEARRRATGFAPASALAAEVEEVPGGVDVAHAGSVRLSLEHEFLSGGRRSAARTLASTDVEAAAAELYATERRVMAIATQTLERAIDWSAIAARLAAEDSLLISAQSSLQTRFAVGEARYVDVLRLRTERLRIQSERAAAVTEAGIARHSLRALAASQDSGIAMTALVDSLVEVGLSTPRGAATLLPAPDVDSLLFASGATRIADAAVAQARGARQLVLANQRPHLTGFIGAQRFAGDNGRFIMGPVFGGAISLPFTAHRANDAAAAAAVSQLVAATAARNATLYGLRADLLAARDRYEAARARLAVYDAALLQGAREERESALASYRSGDLSLIELLDFERALTRAEIDRLHSRIDAAAALADLLTGAIGSAARAANPSTSTSLIGNAP